MHPLALIALACSDPAPPPAPPAPVAPVPTAEPAALYALEAPLPQPDGTTVLAATAAGPLTWVPLLVEGRSYGDGPPFGTVLDHAGRPLSIRGGATCSSPDANALVQRHGRTWLLTHAECAPAGLYLSALERGPDGAWAVQHSRPVDLSAVGGLNQICAGQATPWGSLLGGEEYETDAALWRDGALHPVQAGVLRHRDDSDYADFARWYAAPPSPYANGWMHETSILDAEGATRVERRYAMGRFSHELGRLMPDQRTVYLTDDGSYGILAMFVADLPGQLDSGRLYAARWTQQPGTATAALEWIDLGHATDAAIATVLDRGVQFSDLYTRSVPRPWGCPQGSTLVRGHQAIDECLAPRPGTEALAARLETRRAAALAGATVELHKEEGLALDPAARRLYVAFANVDGGMLADDPPGPADHLALPANPCGVIYALDLGAGVDARGGAPIDSDWVATRAEPVVEGIPLPGGGCDEASISGPDNLDFIPGLDALLIAEDSGREPNRLWAWRQGALVPLFAAHARTASNLAEVSGLSWVPDLDGEGWITVSLQHPGEHPAVVGLLGPLPAGG